MGASIPEIERTNTHDRSCFFVQVPLFVFRIKVKVDSSTITRGCFPEDAMCATSIDPRKV